MKIEKIVINSNEYPEKLRYIYDSPLQLYVLGNKKILNQKAIAIVGARKATEYGKKWLINFRKNLLKRELI